MVEKPLLGLCIKGAACMTRIILERNLVSSVLYINGSSSVLVPNKHILASAQKPKRIARKVIARKHVTRRLKNNRVVYLGVSTTAMGAGLGM